MYRIRDLKQTAQADCVSSAELLDEPDTSIIDLRCQLCQTRMVAPSTRESRRFVSLVCESHIMHKSCFARLPRKECPTCRKSAENIEFTESASLILWRSNVRPPCGCGRTQHTRDEAAACQFRLVTCLYPGCTEPYFLHEREGHYAEFHENAEPVEEPSCPFENCTETQLTLDTYDTHVIECVHRPVTCSCGETGEFYLIQQHQETCEKVRCPSRNYIKKRLGIKLPGGSCRHGPGIACPFEALLRKASAEQRNDTLQLIEDIVKWRHEYAV